MTILAVWPYLSNAKVLKTFVVNINIRAEQDNTMRHLIVLVFVVSCLLKATNAEISEKELVDKIFDLEKTGIDSFLLLNILTSALCI